jgi:hypothetical protein
MAQPHLLTLFMMLTASRNLSLELRQSTSTMIPTPGLSLTILSAMARTYKLPFYTWNANSECARHIICPSASRKATSSQNISNLLGMTFAPRGTGPLNQSTSFLGLGLGPRSCVMCKFIGFAQFYSKYIHHFELMVTPLWTLTIKCKYTNPVVDIWMEACQGSFDDIREAIISDPCLLRFNHNQLVILCTDFSSQDFGYVVCQPGTDDALEAAMAAYFLGSDFRFMTKDSSAVVCPVAFEGGRCRGNKIRLHSHLGECFAGY